MKVKHLVCALVLLCASFASAQVTVTDTMKRADGSAAAGTVLISWAAFTDSSAAFHAAGSQTVTLGSGGSFTTTLFPTVGASPATLYRVQYNFIDSITALEYWTVPSSGPVGLVDVRSTSGPSAAAPALLSGSTILPALIPFGTTANTVAAGDDPRFIDLGIIPGARLASGDTTNATLCPHGGSPNLVMGACGGGGGGSGDAVTIQGIAVSATAPTTTNNVLIYNGTNYLPGPALVGTPSVSQTIVQPNATTLQLNSINKIPVAVDSFNFTRSPGTPATLSAGSNTVTLTTCPLGVNGTDIESSNTPHWIRVVSAGGDSSPSEPVKITGGTCTSGAASGTVVFNSGYSHIAGYQVTSATSGLQEAERFTAPSPDSVIVAMPHTIYTLYGTFSTNQSNFTLDARGAKFDCILNMTCIQMGKLTTYGNGTSTTQTTGKILGARMRPAMVGWSVALAGAVTGGAPTEVVTIPTGPTGFYALIPEQILWLEGASGGKPSTPYGTGEFVKVTTGDCIPAAVNCTVTLQQATPGLTNLNAHDSGVTLSNNVNPSIEDNSNNSTIQDVKWISNTGAEKFGIAIQNDNDQSLTVLNPVVQSALALRNDASFQSRFIFGPGTSSINAGITYWYAGSVSGVGYCVDSFNANDVSVMSAVCQAYTMAGVRFVSSRGLGSGQLYIGGVTHFEISATSVNAVGNIGIPYVIAGTNQSANWADQIPFPDFVTSTAGGITPRFANIGGATATKYYYLVPKNNTLTTGGASCNTVGCEGIPLRLGVAVVDDPSANNVPVKFMWPSGATDARLLRTTSTSATPGVNAPSAPNGTGNYEVLGTIDPAVSCDIHAVCTVTDTLADASLTSYTPVTTVSGTGEWAPYLFHWNGPVVVTNATTGGVAGSSANLLNGFSSYTGCVTSPDIFINTKSNMTISTATGPAGCLMPQFSKFVRLSWPGDGLGATVLEQKLVPDGGLNTGIKGRLNFGPQGTGPYAITTYIDSNYAKTMATSAGSDSGTGFPLRPGWNDADTMLGVRGTLGDVFWNTQTSYEWFINHAPTSTSDANWKLQLSSSALLLKVPADFQTGVLYEFSGPTVTAPSSPAAGFMKGYFKTGIGFCSKDSAGVEYCPGAGGGGGGYATIQEEGAGITQRLIFNCVGTAITCADDSGNVRTNITVDAVTAASTLTANRILLGNNSKIAQPLGSPGTATTLLHGNAAGAPSFAAVSLTADVSGILPGANGGTENGFTAFTGPTTSLKTFTLPNASATILTSNTAVTIGQGGTGQITANAALNALLPSQTGNAGKLLTTDGTNTSWTATSGTISGLTTGTIPKASSSTSLADSCATDNGTLFTITCTGGLSMPASTDAGLSLANNTAFGLSSALGIRLISDGGVAKLSENAGDYFPVAKRAVSGSGTIDFGSIPDGGCLSSTFTVTGAVAGDQLATGFPSTIPAGVIAMMAVSAPDTIQVKECNFSGSASDPPSAQFSAGVIR